MSSINDALRDLQRQFAATLLDRMARLLGQYRKISLSDWQPAEVEALHHQIHSLTGSAGTFGMPSLSDAARGVEIRIKTIVDAATPPDGNTWAAVGAELVRIEQLAQSRLDAGVPSLTPPQTGSRLDDRVPRVYLVEDDSDQAEHLFRALSEDGYQVQVFSGPDEFRAACAGAQHPDAIVLDVTFPEGDSAGIELLAELKAGQEHCPPVVITSVRDDLDTRLAAYRAGASRYLLKPVIPRALIDLLDALTYRIPQEPFRVLLVDDDPLLLEAQATVLRTAGMTVQALTQPRDTLDALNTFRPDVLVLDVYMPGIRGPELAAIVRERDDYLSLPILFLSAEIDMSQQLLALNLGGDDFLVKPVPAQHLVSAVTARAQRSRQNAAIQRRLQTTLYEREREHLALNQHALVSIADSAGNIINANDLFCEVSGYSRDELLDRNHRILKSGQHPDGVYQELWATIASGHIWSGELCNRRKDGGFYWVKTTIIPFLDDSGRPYQYVSIRTDITRIKKRETVQKLVREAAGTLLSAGVDEMEDAIEHCLQQVGEHLGADRAYLFLLNDDGVHISNSHEWCAPGIAPQKDALQNLPLQAIAWWWAQMVQGKIVNISDVAALPPEAAVEQTLFERLGLRSLCGFPLQHEDNPLGFIGFDQVTKSRDWEQDTLDLISLMADQIGSAVVRAVGERALRKQQHFTQNILDSVDANIAVLDTQGVIIAVNRTGGAMQRKMQPRDTGRHLTPISVPTIWKYADRPATPEQKKYITSLTALKR